MPRVDLSYDGPMQRLCDVLLDSGKVLQDVVPEEARRQYRGHIVRETYRWRYRGRFEEIEGAWDEGGVSLVTV